MPMPGGAASGGGEGEETGEQAKGGGVDEFREEVFAVGTLGALNFVVKGMKELPGRKSVVLFSEGFVLFNREDMSLSNRLLEGMRRLTDLANRASVVIYAIDPRGLPTLALTAADSTSGGRRSRSRRRSRRARRATSTRRTRCAISRRRRAASSCAIRTTSAAASGACSTTRRVSTSSASAPLKKPSTRSRASGVSTASRSR